MTTAEATATWTDICALEDLFPGNPVGAVLGGKQIALVRYDRETVYAIANFDPFSKAMVLSRGIVGDRQGEPILVSPIYKQRFALKTGLCMEDPTVKLPIYPVRIADGRVLVGTP
jgi:nitrite reductase (NADH) small subunit